LVAVEPSDEPASAARQTLASGPSQIHMGIFGRPPLEREISVDRVSYKYAGAKQTQDCRDRFNHFDAPILRYWVRLIARACFRIASSTRHNGFVPTSAAHPAAAGISRAVVTDALGTICYPRLRG